MEATFFPSFLPSFPSALQLKVSFGLLNNQPPFFDAMIDGCLGKRHFNGRNHLNLTCF
jgi:hypothetical protein